MFKKILIANRGEIAVRIMATCRSMGIATVAVYSEADSSALHVREADEAYAIGAAPAVESYLRIAKIIEVARQSGAEAIHPGYGFLSENAAFAEACAQADLVFIGPSPESMRLMGSKIAAKQLAQSVNAPTIPGYNGESQDDDVLRREALRIGFPLLIKASAGGGGKGMREVHTESAFLTELAGARREALASFGDATVFLERLILHPRHIEIQIIGDQYGHLIHLGERECSIQRRHQKIIEESPSIALTPELRTQMGRTAVNIARAASYVNAGTLEFMLDTDGRFYFLEMNTRLQVEHPVTELVMGLDLVRHQLLVAAGQPLTLQQEEMHPRGHAIEVRLYAEDPAQNFLPSTGTVTGLSVPVSPGVRLDSGIETADEITQFYDPMIAKLIVSGESRIAAIERLQSALAQTVVFGVTTNLALLQSIARHPAYREGATYTSFLEEYGLLQADSSVPDELSHALQAAALLDLTTGEKASGTRNPWQSLGAWRGGGGTRSISYTYQAQRHRITVAASLAVHGAWEVRVDEQETQTLTYTRGPRALVLLRNGHAQLQVHVERQDASTLVSIHGQVFQLHRQQPPRVESAARGSDEGYAQKALIAPMAGTIVKVMAEDGQEVEQHQVLVILTAMKMEHTIAAPHSGKIRHIYPNESEVVKGGAVIVEME